MDKDYKKMWNVLRKRINYIQKSYLEDEEIYQKNGRTITPYYHYTRIVEIMDELETGTRKD